MASPTNYAQVLAQMARDKTVSATKGFVSGAVQAGLSEMPGYSGIRNILGVSSSIRTRAERLAEQNSKDAVQAQKQGNIIALDTNRELRTMNRNIARQTKVAEQQERRAMQTQMFAEENAREQSLYNDRLLKAMENIGRGSFGAASNDAMFAGNGGGGDGWWDNILQALLGLGGLGMGRRGGATPAPGPGGAGGAPSRRRRGGGGGGRRPPRTPGASAGSGTRLGRFAFGGGRALGLGVGTAARGLAPLLGLAGPAGWGIIAASIFAPYLIEELFSFLNSNALTGPVLGTARNAFRPPNRPSASLGGGGGAAGAGQSDTGAQLPPSTPESDSGIKWRVPLAKGNYRITSQFGEGRETGKHRGIDLAVSKGSVVVAAATGQVVRLGFEANAGNYVVLSHGNGYESKYMHLSTIGVSKGMQISIGRYIGLSGNTGRSTGPHLHFEIWKGSSPVDPATLIPELRGGAKSSTTTKQDAVPQETMRRQSRSLTSQAGLTSSDQSAPSGVTSVSSESSRFSYAGEDKPVIVQLVDEQAKALGRGASASIKSAQILSRSLGGRGRGILSRRVDTRTEEEKLIDEAERRFIKGLERGFTTVYSREITKGLTNLFPEMGKGVKASTVQSNRLFLGQTVSEGFGVPRAISRVLDKAIGKDYSAIFSPIFADLTTTYLEVGSRKLGEAIFSGIGGMDAEASRTLTGQILGNLKAGNKRTAFAQLLTGVSGGRLAYGPEAIFAKYGFATPEAGINFIAEGMAKETAGFVDRTFFGEGGDADKILKEQQTEALKASGVADATKNTDTNTLATSEGVDAGNKQSKEYYAADARKVDIQIAQQEQALQLQKQQIQATQRAGRQAAAGGVTPSGGTFSNLLYDLAGSAVTQKIVGGINNPYAQILAGSLVAPFVTGTVRAVGTSLFSGATGAGFNFASNMGTQLGTAATQLFGEKAGSYVSSLFGKGGGDVVAQTADEILAAKSGNFAAQAGAETGAQAGAESFGGTIMRNLPYIYAGYQALTGDVKGAAVTAGSYYIGTTASAALAAQGISATPIFGIDPISLGISILASFVLGSLFADSPPKPRLVYAIPVTGNNNVNAFQKVFVRDERKFPKEWNDYIISLIRVAFNAHKLIEAKENKPGPYNFIAVAMNSGHVFLVLMPNISAQDAENHYFRKINGKDGNGNWYYHFDIKTPAGQLASDIISKIGEAWKEGAGDSDAIRASVEQLNSKSFQSLSSDLITELKRGDFALDPDVTRGLYGLDPETARAFEASIDASRFTQPPTQDYGGGSEPLFRSPVFDLRTNEWVENPVVNTETYTDYDGNTATREVPDRDIVAIGPNGEPIRALQGETLQQTITRVYGANTSGVTPTGPSLRPTAITPIAGTSVGEEGFRSANATVVSNDNSMTNTNYNASTYDPSDPLTSANPQTATASPGGG